MQNKLIEKIARIIAPDLFDADTEAYLDRLSGKPCDNWAASRGEMKHGMSIGTKRKDARTKAQDAIAAVEAEDWQTMDSAPRGGTEVLGYDAKTKTYHVTFAMNKDDRWHDPDSHYYSECQPFEPTHWRHLPAAPEAE